MQNHIQSEFGRIILNFTEFYKIQRDRWGPFIFLRSNFQTLLLTRRSYYIYNIQPKVSHTQRWENPMSTRIGRDATVREGSGGSGEEWGSCGWGEVRV
jgi:hypothetical protein